MSTPPARDAERLARERAFHDQAAVNGRPQDRFYRVLTAAHAFHLKLVESAIRDREVLEIGCGEGEFTALLAPSSARIVGIDLSEGRIQRARELAATGEREMSFKAMDAEHLDFPANSFDVVCGRAILHHLDVNRALDEVGRVLRPNGRAIFLEPLGHNPLINGYRRFSPDVRTVDEHPLLVDDLQANVHFESLSAAYFHLLALAALPLALVHEPTAHAVARPLEAVDRLLFKLIPPARKLAWIVVIDLSRPRS